MSVPQQGMSAPQQGNAAAGGEDYLDKGVYTEELAVKFNRPRSMLTLPSGVDMIEKKLGLDSSKYRAQNEKFVRINRDMSE